MLVNEESIDAHTFEMFRAQDYCVLGVYAALASHYYFCAPLTTTLVTFLLFLSESIIDETKVLTNRPDASLVAAAVVISASLYCFYVGNDVFWSAAFVALQVVNVVKLPVRTFIAPMAIIYNTINPSPGWTTYFWWVLFDAEFLVALYDAVNLVQRKSN